MTIDLNVVMQIISIVLIAGGGFWAVSKTETKVQIMIDQIKEIRIEVANFSQAAIQIARQDERIGSIESRLQEISNRVFNSVIKKRSS